MAIEDHQHKQWFRDYVTPEMGTFGMGEVWVYFFKETPIGVRHHEKNTAFFIQAAEITPELVSKYSLVPTIELLKQENVDECINEMDTSNETLEIIKFVELQDKISEMIIEEIQEQMNQRLLGKDYKAE